jgi:primosomal protein N' (replication factor Y)
MASPVNAFVGVHPLAGFDKLLHYRLPEGLGPAGPGTLVRVPLRGKMCLGVVGEVGPPKDFPADKLKPVAQVVYPFPALAPDALELARWMAGYYGAPMDAVIEAMVPAAVRRGASAKREKLLALGRTASAEEAAALDRRAPQQARLLAFLEQQFQPQPKRLVLERLGVSAAAAAALVRRGLAREDTRRVERDAYADDWAHGERVPSELPSLNSDQAAAVKAVETGLSARKFGVWLLHGVTGSGKTEVYLRAIAKVLETGGGVIFLVPEVALTPQTVARLRARLEAVAPGARSVVWHSHLSDGERLDGWLAMASGEARIVVGARSAVFAPVRDLRLVVVDEEHEPAYKQAETPRYHGRDAAVMRAKLAGAVCVLGSATPSLESFANAQSGKYRLLRLPVRVDGRRMPDIDIVDMRIEAGRQRGFFALSRRLVPPLQRRPHLPPRRRNAPLPPLRRGEGRPAALPEMLGSGRALARAGDPAGRGGGAADSPESPRGPDGFRHDVPQEPIPGDPGGLPPGEDRHPGGDADDRQGAGLSQRHAGRSRGRGHFPARSGF